MRDIDQRDGGVARVVVPLNGLLVLVIDRTELPAADAGKIAQAAADLELGTERQRVRTIGSSYMPEANTTAPVGGELGAAERPGSAEGCWTVGV